MRRRPAQSTRLTSASFSHSGGITSFCAPASTRPRRAKPPRRLGSCGHERRFLGRDPRGSPLDHEDRALIRAQLVQLGLPPPSGLQTFRPFGPLDLQWMAGLLLLGHTLPRSTIPVTATSRPLYTAVMATAPLWSRPSARAGTGHVANASSCRVETACPPGSRNGTGLDATHYPRIWSLSPSDSLGGPATVRGHARPKPTWFP